MDRAENLEADARDQLDGILTAHPAIIDERPADCPVTSEVAEGGAAWVLLSAAEDADLLVVGSRGHGGGQLLNEGVEDPVELGGTAAASGWS